MVGEKYVPLLEDVHQAECMQDPVDDGASAENSSKFHSAAFRLLMMRSFGVQSLTLRIPRPLALHAINKACRVTPLVCLMRLRQR